MHNGRGTIHLIELQTHICKVSSSRRIWANLTICTISERFVWPSVHNPNQSCDKVNNITTKYRVFSSSGVLKESYSGVL